MSETQDRKRKILIAEDDPVSRRLLQLCLVKWGYDVTVAADGEDALRIFESENAPRLGVLDWMMPGMEGVQVCRKIRERTGQPYVYLLLLTARSKKEDLLAGLQSGADDYLTKPFDSQELHARLHVGQRIMDLHDDLIQARDALRFRATHDDLTGLLNRTEILDALRREWSRQVREGGSFGIILMDLDHFKGVNDTHGHLSGDAVLQEAARRMTDSLRTYDMVGRYGGEEFLIVAPSSDVFGTLGLAERIRLTMESSPIATPEGKIPVTASFGVAVSSSLNSFTPEKLVQMADEALYRAKRSGRNRFELAIPLSEEIPLNSKTL